MLRQGDSSYFYNCFIKSLCKDGHIGATANQYILKIVLRTVYFSNKDVRMPAIGILYSSLLQYYTILSSRIDQKRVGKSHRLDAVKPNFCWQILVRVQCTKKISGIQHYTNTYIIQYNTLRSIISLFPIVVVVVVVYPPRANCYASSAAHTLAYIIHCVCMCMRRPKPLHSVVATTPTTKI